ncbi:hypothetical protein RIF29_39992 [Crotalaria pallida]|uniref:DUF4057 domain-containing protein n=1 Tax=Crotalaria pallida TaxID=3830 RepID=A0AAN9E4Q6_CROPI
MKWIDRLCLGCKVLLGLTVKDWSSGSSLGLLTNWSRVRALCIEQSSLGDPYRLVRAQLDQTHESNSGYVVVTSSEHISFGEEESVSPKKPTTIPEVAKQRELNGTLESEDSKLKKQLPDAKCKELSGHDIFAPPPEIKPNPITPRILELKGSIDIGIPSRRHTGAHVHQTGFTVSMSLQPEENAATGGERASLFATPPSPVLQAYPEFATTGMANDPNWNAICRSTPMLISPLLHTSCSSHKEHSIPSLTKEVNGPNTQ